MRTNSSLVRCGVLAAALFLVFEVRATTFQIDVDTSLATGLQLEGGNWDLVFDLFDSSDQSNTVAISDFKIAGGGLTGAGGYPKTFGTVTGNLTGIVTIDDSGGSGEYVDNAILGTLISFFLTTTDNLASGGTPDGFAFYITYADGTNFDPSGLPLVAYSIGNGSQPETFCPQTAPNCVSVAPVVVAVPEPSALALAVAALVASGLARSRRRAAFS